MLTSDVRRWYHHLPLFTIGENTIRANNICSSILSTLKDYCHYQPVRFVKIKIQPYQRGATLQTSGPPFVAIIANPIPPPPSGFNVLCARPLGITHKQLNPLTLWNPDTEPLNETFYSNLPYSLLGGIQKGRPRSGRRGGQPKGYKVKQPL